MWQCGWTALFSIIAVVSGKVYRPALKDFPTVTLQKHIQQSRHLPVCIIFRNSSDQGTLLEHTAKSLWTDALKEKVSYAYWQLGSFVVSQSTNIGLAQPLPPLRCYTSPKRFVDYVGKGSEKRLQQWLHKQVSVYENGLPEASVLAVENATLLRRHTLVGFASSIHHYALEELLAELHDEFSSDLGVFFVHPHNDEIRSLSTLCRVPGGPNLVFLAQRNIGEAIKVSHTLSSVDITRHNIDYFLTASNIKARQMNQDTFDSLFEETRHYIPTLLCLHAWWAPHVITYLHALQRTMDESTELNLKLRFVHMEVTSQTKHAISRHLDTMVVTNLPIVLLLNIRWRHRTVVGIDQVAFPGALPTPGSVVAFLQEQGVPLITPSGEQVVYQPWGRTDPSKVSLLSEGPAGSACYVTSHNETDNTPLPVPVRLPRPRVRKNNTQATPPRYNLLKNPVEERLNRIGGVPMVTDDLWYDVIEKSHAPAHPLYAGAEWRGEVTQVSLVIFIIDDCASCRRHMELFGELNQALRAVEGGRVYLLNCSRDPVSCSRHNVTGFPTLAAFRGLGWLHGGGSCLSGRPARPYVQITYHGVLRLEQVVSWFAEAAAPAVQNLRFQDTDLDDTSADVWLVATMIPRRSDYLHKARLTHRSLYPFKCFRFACEQLFAHVSCKVRYSREVPPAEFDDDVRAEDMVVTQVNLERSDGLSTVVSRLGEPLLDTLEEEAENSVHLLHGAHQYPLPTHSQRCEDNAAVCTEYLVSFTRDHARLSVNPVTMATFHAAESVLTGHSMPILVAFAHKDNLTADAKFYKTLTRVGRHLYRDIVTVSVDVDQFMHWANRFTPLNYADTVIRGAEPWLYYYPRFCLLYWNDHQHAAFYPDPQGAPPARYKTQQLIAFAENFLKDPASMLVPTEHF